MFGVGAKPNRRQMEARNTARGRVRATVSTGTVAIAITTAALAAALLWVAARADDAWFERHVLLPYYYFRPARLPGTARAAARVAALGVLAAGALLGRWWRRARPRVTAAGTARAALALA